MEKLRHTISVIGASWGQDTQSLSPTIWRVLSLQSGPECCVNARHLSYLPPPFWSSSPFPSVPFNRVPFIPLISARVYYSSTKWQQGQRLCTLTKDICGSPLFTCLEGLWWRDVWDNRLKSREQLVRIVHMNASFAVQCGCCGEVINTMFPDCPPLPLECSLQLNDLLHLALYANTLPLCVTMHSRHR